MSSDPGRKPIEPAQPLTGKAGLTPSTTEKAPAKVLVAGMGNVLEWDDGWGIEVAQRLAHHPDLPSNTRVVEIGIGGVNLVQELFDGYAALLIVDATDRGGAPGTIYLLEPEVPDLASLPFEQRQDFLADMHYTNPSKALTLARALGVLPPKVFILGCQPTPIDGLGIGLSEPVNLAVERGVGRLLAAIEELS
jgi:hydrogenase maturation protease